MTARLESVTFDVADSAVAAAFWAALLDREVVDRPGGVLVPGDPDQVGLGFVTSAGEQHGSPRLHLHLTSTSPEDQRATVDRAIQLGARHLDVGQAPGDAFVVLADPAGNHLCVIEPGNGFLAGTGRLGEVTCEGSREVGLFWRDALGWSLVWDEDGETSVQSPLGGTKISWGGPPVAPKHGRNRQRVSLATDDLRGEVTRLVALGATVLCEEEARVELADPDGNEFELGLSPAP